VPALVVLFLITAVLYASVGFGGGSTYNALLVLGDTDYRVLPAIALICNIIVVTGGTLRYSRAGLIPWGRISPMFALSVPLAWLGGRLPVPETLFIGLLGAALLISGVLMLIQRDQPAGASLTPRPATFVEPTIGGGVGLLAGVVGIGGGIFLAPILHLRRWGPAKTIAGTASVFILVNSLAGLAGQVMKLGDLGQLSALSAYWPLFPAVFVGGQIGSLAGARLLPEALVRRMTALLVLYVAARLALRLWTMTGGAP